MLMALNSLAAVQKNPIIETAKKKTKIINYIATHLDPLKEYRRSGIIIQIYSDVSYISGPEEQSRSDEHVFLGKNTTHR